MANEEVAGLVNPPDLKQPIWVHARYGNDEHRIVAVRCAVQEISYPGHPARPYLHVWGGLAEPTPAPMVLNRFLIPCDCITRIEDGPGVPIPQHSQQEPPGGTVFLAPNQPAPANAMTIEAIEQALRDR